jgi:preprotein translocase subunit SecA
MFSSLFDSNERQINKLRQTVAVINSYEPQMHALTDAQIVEKTRGWQQELRKLSEKDQDAYLDKLLPEAFALVREAGSRALNMRHFDVQLVAGMVLHQGKIAEQKTGEGKTLTATLPLYLNSLTGRGVHLVTPNDYLSRHGAGWMGPLYEKLGLSVGVIMEEKGYVFDASVENNEFEDSYAKHLKVVEKQEVYKCDIVYGTNHQFGFDYLRDNMVYRLKDMVQTNANSDWGAHNFAVVDEVDFVLIDVARTPLIISSPDDRPASRYMEADRIIKSLVKDSDYEVEEKFRNVSLTDLGIRRVERLLGVKNLYEEDFEMVHLIEQALTARALYEKDRDYVVKDGKVTIVDQFTGRLLPSNRYSNGLHQAIEAKEGVAIQQESKTLGEVSYQNYFRMYKKLAGMTGTAITEAEEFYKIYKLDVVVIPTNKNTQRIDSNDVVYKSEAGKFRAVANEVVERNTKGQPVLIGTTSVEKSELLHELLSRRGIKHEILNAKNHEREALIIAQAGKKGAVTISTNMAGRGVDILLGGDPIDMGLQKEVRELGGLHVIGTERHESRRIDNQLRGRAGRQGDPGSSRFYVSLQDDLMRIFGGEQIQRLMDRFGLDETVPLEASLVTRSIENAQKRVEGLNFDRRKQVVEMDDVINVHREVVYKLRRRILELAEGNAEHEDWFVAKLQEHANFSREHWEKLKSKVAVNTWGMVIAQVSLPVIGSLWIDHLVDMDQIREGIGLRGYAQRDPMVEYKHEGHERFTILISKIYTGIAQRFSGLDEVTAVSQDRPEHRFKNVEYKYAEQETGFAEERAITDAEQRVVDESGRQLKVQKVVTATDKVGRNDPCPCGSGKKYKSCGLLMLLGTEIKSRNKKGLRIFQFPTPTYTK